LEIQSHGEFKQHDLDYTYSYGGERYGFYNKDLIEALHNYSNVFLIVRSAEIIRQIQQDFNYINVVPIYVYTDLNKVKTRLRKQHFTLKQIEFRLSRHKLAFEDYLRHPALYKEVLINNSSVQDYHRLIDLIIDKYSSMPNINERLIFLLLSFDSNNPLLQDVSNTIKRSVNDYSPKFTCLNLDDVKKGSYEISAEAKSQIKKCRLAIIDLTGNRPNVYYELGFVHGISKECILTCHKDTKPHFYPAGHRILFYKNVTELEKLIAQELKGVLKLS